MPAPSTLELNFVGPFSFLDSGNSVFKSPFASSAGLYLWTVRQRCDGSHLIHYVGETRSLAQRHREHLIHILGLNYGIFDPEKAQEGICKLVWPGLWRDRSPDGPSRQMVAYNALHDLVLAYVSVLSIFFAEVETGRRLRKHIEGCIGWNLRNNHPEEKTLYPDDNRVGTMEERNHGDLLILSNERIRGLDSRIPY